MATATEPRTLADFPEYTEAVAKRDKVQKQLDAAVQAERELMEQGLVAANSQSIGDAAVALLEGKRVKTDVPTVAEVQRKRQVADKALKMAEQAVEHTRLSASRAICADLAEENERLIDDATQAIIAAHDALLAIEAQRDALRRQGIHPTGLRRVRFASAPWQLGKFLLALDPQKFTRDQNPHHIEANRPKAAGGQQTRPVVGCC